MALVLVADNVCAIELPLPLEAPVALDCVSVQLKVVPATLLGFVIVKVVLLPEANVCEEGLTDTVGAFATVTVNVTLLPVHPPADGVTVYVAVPLPVEVNVWFSV